MNGAGSERRRDAIALALLLTAFVAAVAPLLVSLNVWQDETYSLRTTSGDLAHAWRSAIVFEGLPPFYPLLLEGWRTLNGSVAFARLLSVLLASVAIACAFGFARRVLPGIPPSAFAFALAADPFLVYAALDIRLYALAIAFSAILVWTFFEGFFAERPSRGARIAHVVTAIAAMYTQYFAGALLLGCFVALLAARRGRALLAYAVAGAIVVVACLPIVTFLPEQLSTFRTTSGTTHYSASSVLVTALTFALPHDWLPSWQHGAGNVAYVVVALALAVLILAGRPRATPALGATVAIVLTILAFFLTVPIALHQTLVVPRHLAVVLVPVLALVFALFDALRVRRGLALGAYVVAYAVFAALSFVAIYGAGAKFGDFERAAAFVRAHERPGQTIYVYDQEMTTPLGYYYRGPNRIVGLPEPQRFDRFDARLFVFHDAREVRARLAPVRPGATVWLYEADLCTDRSDPFGCRFLEQVVREDFDVVLERPFYKATVRELVRRHAPRAGDSAG